MRNQKGQALVEFVLIFPLFLFLILGGIDLFRIFSFRGKLEAIASDAALLYRENQTPSFIQEKINQNQNEKITVDIQKEMENVNLIVTSQISIWTPGLNLLLGNPYSIQIKRVVPYES